jgi:hypothetical protein
MKKKGIAATNIKFNGFTECWLKKELPHRKIDLLINFLNDLASKSA